MEIQMFSQLNQSNAKVREEFQKWRPSKIKDPEALCDDKDRCDGLKSQYNVSNKLLTWEKSRPTERQVRYDFACKDWTNKDNGKVFEMTPYPENFATCTCNYN